MFITPIEPRRKWSLDHPGVGRDPLDPVFQRDGLEGWRNSLLKDKKYLLKGNTYMTPQPHISVPVLVLNDKRELLLGYRTKSPAENTWAPPGGKLEFGESFEECAIRETKEETNLDIESVTFVTAGAHILPSASHHFVLIHMQAYYPGGQKLINREPTKAREWRWFSYNRLPKDTIFSILELKSNGILKTLME